MNAHMPRIASISCAVLVLALAVASSGCTGDLLKTKFPVPATYVLAPLPLAETNKPAAAVDLVVAIPIAAPGLDSERIATLHGARRLDYYQDARWGATDVAVVQSLTVASLQNQGLFRSVTPEQARVSATHLLDLQLRDFQAEYGEGATPTVRVTLIATLIRLKDRKLLGSFPASSTVRAQENRLDVVVTAFESASQQVIASLSQQTAAALGGDAP